MYKNPVVLDSWDQVLPPSVVFQIPAPREDPANHPSPVATYATSALVGSNAMAVTAMLSQELPALCQTLLVLVMSLLYHSPPVTPPAHTLLPPAAKLVGSQASARVRPPTLLGPRSTHALEASPGTASCARNKSAYDRAFTNRSWGG